MPTYNNLANPRFKWFDSNGDPAAGWKVHTYTAGTSTEKASYDHNDVENTNPVILDSNGEADIYLDGSYKIVLKDDDDVEQWTRDNVEGASLGYLTITVVAAEANLGTGQVDGELKFTDTGNLYEWDEDNTKWTPLSGNRYTTAALPTSVTYTLLTGTTVWDTTLDILKYWDGTAWQVQATHPFNMSRPDFRWKDADEIYIDPGGYYLSGVGWVYWTSTLTFHFESAGSNSGSDDFAANKYFYLAIDYSSISGPGVIDETNFIARNEDNVTPAFDGVKGGWYQDTNDRTILAVWINGTPDITEFYIYNDLYICVGQIHVVSGQDVDDSWVDADSAFIIPLDISQDAVVMFQVHNGTDYLRWRPNGSAITTTAQWAADGDCGHAGMIRIVHTDSSGLIELLMSASGAATASMYVYGYAIPPLM